MMFASIWRTDMVDKMNTTGTIVATGANRYGQCDVTEWTDILAVATEESGGIHGETIYTAGVFMPAPEPFEGLPDFGADGEMV